MLKITFIRKVIIPYQLFYQYIFFKTLKKY